MKIVGLAGISRLLHCGPRRVSNLPARKSHSWYVFLPHLPSNGSTIYLVYSLVRQANVSLYFNNTLQWRIIKKQFNGIVYLIDTVILKMEWNINKRKYI